VIAEHTHQPIGMQVLIHSNASATVLDALDTKAICL